MTSRPTRSPSEGFALRKLPPVLFKEAIDAVRDRRSLTASLVSAIVGPLAIFLLLTTLAQQADEDEPLQVAVAGAERAPTLIEWLAERDVRVEAHPDADAAKAALGPERAVALVVPEGYAERYEARRPVAIGIFADLKRDRSEVEARQLEDLVEAYGSQVAVARLVAEGVRPDAVSPFTVTRYDLSRTGGAGVQFSRTLTYLFLIAPFVSGAFMAADSVAGERERRSLQPLLAQPVTPGTLVLGKWLVAAAVAALVSAATIVLGGFLIGIAPLAELGLRLRTGPSVLLLASLSVVPLAGGAAALQVWIAARAKSYREASTYAQYTVFLPILITGAALIGGIEYDGVTAYLPITGHDYLLRELFLEGRASPGPFLGTTATTLAVAGVFLWLSARVLRDEKALGS